MKNSLATRNHALDILRIVAMLLIVLGHYIYWGINTNPKLGANAFLPSGIIDWTTMETVRLISTTAVDLYVFITGYFLIKRTEFRWNGFVKVWVQTVFYSLGLFLLLVLCGRQTYSLKGLIENGMPITFAPYWFVQKYLGLLLMAPFLSKLAMALKQKEYQILLLIMFFLFFSLPIREPFNSGTVCSLSWFIFLYMLAGYYRLHGTPAILKENAGYLTLTILAFLLVGMFGINFLQNGNNFAAYKYYSTGADGFLFFLSVPLFIFFAKQSWDGKIVKLIAKMAPYTFGVYLIHEFRPLANIIWGEIMPKTVFLPQLQVVHCVIFSVVLFIVCIIIDFLRFKFVRLVSTAMHYVTHPGKSNKGGDETL